MKKYLFVNFKAYQESCGENAVSLAKKIESASKGFGVNVMLVVCALDLQLVSKSVSLNVFAQHFDPLPSGPFTGSIGVESLISAGASGSVLNHAEKKVPGELAAKSIEFAKNFSFPVLVCAESIEKASSFALLKPAFIAFEPPELIGGSVSVSTAKPDVIKDFVKKVRLKSPKTVPIVGAGIKNSLDVSKSLEFGAQGVFVSSGIVKASDQKKALKEILGGFGVTF